MKRQKLVAADDAGGAATMAQVSKQLPWRSPTGCPLSEQETAEVVILWSGRQ